MGVGGGRGRLPPFMGTSGTGASSLIGLGFVEPVVPLLNTALHLQTMDRLSSTDERRTQARLFLNLSLQIVTEMSTILPPVLGYIDVKSLEFTVGRNQHNHGSSNKFSRLLHRRKLREAPRRSMIFLYLWAGHRGRSSQEYCDTCTAPS